MATKRKTMVSFTIPFEAIEVLDRIPSGDRSKLIGDLLIEYGKNQNQGQNTQGYQPQNQNGYNQPNQQSNGQQSGNNQSQGPADIPF